MISLRLSPRQIVALYLSLEGECTFQYPDLPHVQTQLSRILSEGLSIEQHEQLERLYAEGYLFTELEISAQRNES